MDKTVAIAGGRGCGLGLGLEVFGATAGGGPLTDFLPTVLGLPFARLALIFSLDTALILREGGRLSDTATSPLAPVLA